MVISVTIHHSLEIKENAGSVAERVLDLENFFVEEKFTNADEMMQKTNTPRNLRFSRNAERYKTQPITQREIVSTQR